MPVLTLPWLGAVVATIATAVAFFVLARRSAGGPIPWSIVAGLARGVGAWSRGRDELSGLRLVSPRGEDPGPPPDRSGGPPAPVNRRALSPETRGGAEDPGFLVGVEIEELGSRRI